MTGYSLIPLIAAIAYVPLFVIVLYSRPWQRQHLLFTMYLVSAIVWSSVSFLLHSSFLPEHKMLLARIMTVAFIWMAVQLYVFSRRFGYGSYAHGVAVGYTLLLAAIVLATLGYIPESVTVGNKGVQLSIGIWFPVLFVPLFFLVVDNVVALLRKLRALTDQVQRTRVTYILIGVCMMAVFSLSNGVEFLRRFPIDHFGNLAAACVWTYATVQHQLVDVRMVARRGLSWVAVIIVAIVGYLFLYTVVGMATHVQQRALVTALATVGALIIGLAIYQLRYVFTRLVDRLFYRERYDYRQKLVDFARDQVRGVSNLKDLGRGLLPLIMGSLSCQRAYLMLPETISGDFIVEFTEPKRDSIHTLRIGQDSPIADWLRRENRYLTCDKLDIMPEFRGMLVGEGKGLKELNIEVFFPIINRGNLIGILMLENKQSVRFTLEDINLVEDIMRQVAVTMEKEFLQEQLRKREHELILSTTELQNANKELEAFVHSVSHDLRAPLRGIDGWSLALLEDYEDKLDKQGRQYLNRIRTETQRMDDLIDALLQLSRISRAPIELKQVDLTAIAKAIATRLRDSQLSRKAEIIIQPKLTSQCDANLLDIALHNLLDNAWKFTGRCSRTRIEFGKTNNKGNQAFFVRDNGVGFDMAYADKLFGAFQRLHKPSDFPGTGIGLATVQRIVRRHGGRLWAEAQVDKGATFYFTLKESE
jgi:signal transduction histidine kinase